jgi:hypothetical protein
LCVFLCKLPLCERQQSTTTKAKKKKTDPTRKMTKAKRVVYVYVAEHLLNRCETLSSNPSSTKNK